MIHFILSLFLSIIFLELSLLHFYWATGGQWGLKNALPANPKGELVMLPGKVMTVSVALILLLFSLLYLRKADVIRFYVPDWFLDYGYWMIPIFFIIRAIGDFRYVGFFKRIKKTNFARYDKLFYSPLCVLIGIMGLMIMILK